MAAEYDVYPTPSPEGKNEEQTYHARIVNKDTITTQRLAQIIEHGTSMTEGDVAGVLRALSYQIIRQLSDGKRVHLDGLGYFSVTVNSPSVTDRKKIRGDMVKFKTVRFLPEKNMKTKLADMRFERSDNSRHSLSHSKEGIEEKLVAYLQEHYYITRSDFQMLFGFTKSMALRWLNKLEEEGIIMKGGNSSSPIYELWKESQIEESL